MRIELQYALTVDDLHEFQYAIPRITKTLPAPKGIKWGAVIGWGIVFGIVLLMFLYRHEANPRPPAAGAPEPKSGWPIIAGFWLTAFVLVWWFVFRPRFFKSAAKKALVNNPTFGNLRQVMATEECLTISEPTASFNMAWTHFILFGETENLFVLMASRDVGFPIPKRAFVSPDQMNEFRTFARDHIGNVSAGFPVQPSRA
jgi:hypothetical protein